jgi:mRNA interferase RelE/StbE
LNPSQKESVKNAVQTLKLDPIPIKSFDVIKLKGYENGYRIRIGKVRIVYFVNWDDRLIEIQFIGLRGKAYKKSDD